MKKTYVNPCICVVDVKVEKGFATSAADSFGIDQFQYADPGTDSENTAW